MVMQCLLYILCIIFFEFFMFSNNSQVVELVNTQLPVSFITDLMGVGSLFYKLRFARSTETLQELMSLYHAIMLLKNVPLLEEAYRYEWLLYTLFDKCFSGRCHLLTFSNLKHLFQAHAWRH